MVLVHEYRTPDVYFERTPVGERGQRLEKVRVDIAGFLGFASRGPVGTPVQITSWKAFEDVFGGFAADCFLPQSVFGFFTNGGSIAYVCRVARLEGPDASASANLVLRDLYGRPTLQVTARDPGTWGNKVRVRCVAASKPPRTAVRADVKGGATEATVSVVRGFEPGAILKISDGQKTEYAVLRSVDRKTLTWEPEHAPRADYGAEKTTIEGVELQLQVTSADQFEIHDNLALSQGPHSRSLVQRVNEASRLVRLEDLASRTPVPYNLPALDLEEALTAGKDGSGAAQAEDFIGWDRGPGNRAGLHAFEDVEELGLILAPDLTTISARSADLVQDTRTALGAPGSPVANRAAAAVVRRPAQVRDERQIEAVQHELVSFCERKKTVFAILDSPPGMDPDQVADWRTRFDTKYAACYYPWLKVIDPLTRTVKIVPPSGHVAGLYARTDLEQGVHKAPANETLNDVVGLERDVTKDLTDRLSPDGINCIRALRGRGIRVWGARTLTSDKLWEHVPVRRLFIMVERSIAEGTEWAVFENNEWKLWKAVEREVSRFLTGIWKEGMLQGTVPEQAFYVKCDETTNPPEARNAGEFACDIGVAAVRPAEFIVFRIGQRTQDIITEEPVS